MKRLITEEQLRIGVDSLAKQIDTDFPETPLTLIGVLTGSIMLLSDLARAFDRPLEIGLVQASSYRGATTQPGELTVRADLLPDVRDRTLILVDDIFDTGHTLEKLLNELKEFSPREVRSAVLLRKLGRQETDVEPDYIAFDIPDEFVVGYGLDYDGRYRNLPYVAALEEHDLRQESSV